MKRYLYFNMLCICLLYTAGLAAQSITITPQRITVKAALEQLTEKAGIHFMHAGDVEPILKQKVFFQKAAGSVNELLAVLKEQTNLSFQRSGNTVAIKLVKVEKGVINGQLTAADGKPLHGARVQLGSAETKTDIHGKFVFSQVAPARYMLEISHENYEDYKEQLVVKSGKNIVLTIVLNMLGGDKNTLNPVVVTGQYRPQSLNKSIYRVEVIDKKQIDNMAVSNVGELLKQQLNIEIENQSGIGRSKVRVLGLNSQYVKILMDNIPIAGDENMGSDVDLTTISLDDVERVEIVKGAMGVEYGANTIAGVINIITKKTAKNKTDLTLEIQEETVRKEYNLNFDTRAKGRHLQKMNISHRLKDNLSIGASVSHDMFNGYRGQYKGAGFVKGPVDAAAALQRGYEWSPKDSWNGNAYVSKTGKHVNIFYKFNVFKSSLTNYDHRIYGFTLKDEQLDINGSVNNDYRTTRYNHHLSLRGDVWKNAYYTVDISLQKNALEHRRQGINLHDNSVIDKRYGIPGSERLKATDWDKYYQSQGVYAKGTFLKPLLAGKLNYNIGFEMDNTEGKQGYTNWFNDVSLSTPVEQTLFTGAVYSSFEWNVSEKLMIRPGFRMNYNNKLKMRTNESVTTRLKLNNNNDLRVIIGTSTRFPNYEELYSWYVNSVHDYRGNPDLLPEYGKSIEVQWAHRRGLGNNIHLETSVSSMFQHIKDRIITVTYFIEGEPQITGRNTYTNENKYNGLLNQLNVNLVSDKFSIAVAGSVLGYRGDDGASVENYKRFLINEQATLQATYVLPKDIRVAVFYRYVGRQPLYTFVPKNSVGTEPATEFYRILNETEAYHNTDFNVAKSFLNKKIEIRAGVRNIFDVTDIGYKPVAVPAALENYNPSLRTMRLYYGRSYFVKISYNIFN